MAQCSQANCRIADTGICLDGHKQGCPHLLPDQPNADPPPDQTALRTVNNPPVQELRRFHSGEKLTVSEASRLLNDRPARVVLCVGAQDSGKSTFLARLAELFRAGSFLGYRFAGSITLCAFERASWLATIDSGVPRPDTRRTDRIENDTFLHLRLDLADDPNSKFDLLISDLAGETFPTAVASREFCTNLRALARADHLVVFLDSERLSNQARRHPECDNARAFLQRVVSVKYRPKNLHLQVVFSRYDYIINHPQRSAQEKFCKTVQVDFTKRFAEAFATVKFWQIAARPEGGLAPTDAEIQSLFSYWLQIPRNEPTPLVHRNLRPARDFCAFGLV